MRVAADGRTLVFRRRRRTARTGPGASLDRPHAAPKDRHLLADEQHTLLAAGCQRN